MAYPFRPPAVRPKKPSKGTGNPRSESSGRKARVFYSGGPEAPAKNLGGDRVDLSRCVIGHSTPGSRAFREKYKQNLLKIQAYHGGAKTTYVV